MLGDKILDERGKITGTRVLPGDDYRYVKLEMSFQGAGTLFGAQTMDMGTFTAFERVPGQLYGEGQGILQTQDGESAIWNGHGVGRPSGDGLGLVFRASIAFQAGQGKLARLNQVLVVLEYEQDGAGNYRSEAWEWK